MSCPSRTFPEGEDDFSLSNAKQKPSRIQDFIPTMGLDLGPSTELLRLSNDPDVKLRRPTGPLEKRTSAPTPKTLDVLPKRFSEQTGIGDRSRRGNSSGTPKDPVRRSSRRPSATLLSCRDTDRRAGCADRWSS